MAENKKHVIEFGDESKKLISILEQQLTLFKSIGDAITKSYSKLPSEVITQLQQLNDAEIKAERLKQESLKTQKLVDDANKRALKILQDKDAQERKTLKLHTDFQNAMTRQQKAQERLNKVNADAQRPYIQLQARWQQAQKTLADLIVSQGQNAEATKRQRKEFEALDKQIKTVDAITKNYSKNVGNYASAIGGNLGKLTSAFGIVGGVTGGVAILKDAFNVMREFDSQMINVQKTTGLTNKELSELKDTVVDLSKELGFVSSSKLGEYMAVAGQLGVKGKKNLLDFTEAMAKLEVASTIAGEQGASEMARFLTLVDGGVQNVKAFGNEVVILGNNFAATEGEILSNATRIAQSTGVYNLGRQQVLAYATATKAVGVEAELVGSTMGRTLGIFEKSIRTGKNLESITKVLGTTQSELSERFKRDASGVLMDYIGALNKTFKAGGSVNAQLEAIGITAVRDQAVISSLATKGFGTLQDAMTKVGEAGTAMSDEFDNASKKINNRLASLKNKWDNFILGVDNGEGAISNFVIRSINSLEKLINVLDRLNSSWDQVWEKAYSEGQRTGENQAERFLGSAKSTEERLQAMQKVYNEIKKTEAELSSLQKQEAEISEMGGFKRFMLGKVHAELKEQIEERENFLGQYKGFLSRMQDENSKEALMFSGLGGAEAGKTETAKANLSKAELDKIKRAEQERLATIFATNKLELEYEIENNKNIALINAKNKEEQLAAQIAYNAEKVKLLDLEYAEEVRLAENNSEKLLLAKSKYTISTKKLEADTERINKEVQEKQYQDALKLANMLEDNDAKNAMKSQLMLAKTEQDKIDVRLKYLQKQRDIIDRNELQEIESGKHTANELLIILEEYNQKRIELNQKANEIIAEQAKKAEENVKNYLSKFNDMGNFGFSSLNVFTTIEENGKTMFENLLSDAKDWQSKMAVIVGAVGEVFKDVMGAMQQASNARFENELEQLQQSYEINLMFAGDSAEAKTRLEEELAEKQKEIRKKQAESDKKYAIMTSLINTSQAVVSVLAQEPGGLIKKGIAAAIVGGMGLAQTAMIAATPIPEFWTGTDNAPEGLAWTQEKGAEVITDKKGNVKTMGHNKGATLTWLESGDKVYKNRQEYFNNELNGILGSNGISNHIEVNSEFDYDRFESIANKNKQQTFVNFDEDGFNVRTASRNNRQNLKNKYARR